MHSEPKIISRADQPFVSIRLTVDRSEISTKAPPLIGEIFGWAASKGIKPAGDLFFNYTHMGPGESMDLEVGLPTERQEAGDGRVVAGTIPGGRFATLRHTGPYDQLYGSHMALHEWLAKEGLQPSEGTKRGLYDASLLEIYVTDPDKEPDPRKWVTDIAARLGH